VPEEEAMRRGALVFLGLLAGCSLESADESLGSVESSLTTPTGANLVVLPTSSRT
jgi:hypothetical protein